MSWFTYAVCYVLYVCAVSIELGLLGGIVLVKYHNKLKPEILGIR